MKKCFLDASHFRGNSTGNSWILIELHGDLTSTTGNFEEKLKIGDIRQFSSNGKYELCIGSHKLEGELVKLDNPHIVTRKVRKLNKDNELEEVRFEVQGIAREKIVFAKRPIPMMESKRAIHH